MVERCAAVAHRRAASVSRARLPHLPAAQRLCGRAIPVAQGRRRAAAAARLGGTESARGTPRRGAITHRLRCVMTGISNGSSYEGEHCMGDLAEREADRASDTRLPGLFSPRASHHWVRIVMDRETRKLVRGIQPGGLDVLEISGDSWG